MQLSSSSLYAFAAVLMLSFPANAELAMGETSSDYGTVIVEKNIANPEVPTHFIVLNPLDGSSSAGSLIFRCKDNKTEAFYTAAQFEFFGSGATPDINARFASESSSSKLAASGSSGMGDAAFINNPIGFIVNFAGEKEVVLSGSYYGGSFAALFKADDLILKAIYEMAGTCEWTDKLPAQEGVSSEVEKGPVEDAQIETALKQEVNKLVEKYGLDEVKEAIAAIGE